MSQPLAKSIQDTIDRLESILLNVEASGIEFEFAEEQLSFQLEGLVFEFSEAIDNVITRYEKGD